jgi:hypothetical protein
MAFNGIDLKTHICPECDKYRMYLPIEQEPTKETEIKDLPNGDKKAFFKNMCEFCEIKMYKKYFQPKPADVKKVLDAMKKGDTDQSLEDLL